MPGHLLRRAGDGATARRPRRPRTTREYGRSSIEILCKDGLFADLASHERETVWMSHGDCVAVMPEGFEALARSDDGIYRARWHG